MITLESYLAGSWRAGRGKAAILVNPATEAPLAETSSEGLDFGAACRHAREVGGPALRAMSYAERGALLLAMSTALHAHRDELLDLAVANGGNTRGDAKFDVDGATGTLAAYGAFGRELGEGNVRYDGEGVALGRSPKFWGEHLLASRTGVAVHINAFNFPAWGFAEKAACALLAGMPVISKPATSTALLTWRMMKILVDESALPGGAVQLVCGSAGDLLDHLGPQDVLAFTGSAETGFRLRSRESLLRASVPVNVEADSLNAAVLGPDAAPGGDTWRLFVKDVVREVTQKAGQKCTAARRVIVPQERIDDVQAELAAALAATVVGDPAHEGVRMGPVTTARQLADGREGIGLLMDEADVVCGGPDPVRDAVGAPGGKGYFIAPTLLRARDAATASVVHRHEVFGPVTTLLAYDGDAARAAELVARGEGSLVTSAYSDDRDWTEAFVRGAAPWNGRIYLGSDKVADVAFGSGAVLPQLVHGGPGRAGGGEELGGLRGLSLYEQRTALQGGRGIVQRLFSR